MGLKPSGQPKTYTVIFQVWIRYKSTGHTQVNPLDLVINWVDTDLALNPL